MSILDPVTSERICLTLLHSLWQFAAVALLAWVVERCTGRKRVNQPPPFMDEPFKWPEHDPFRMLAEIIAATVYAEGDPHRAIQVLAFSSGDSDTVCTFLGTLMGIWYGEPLLLQNANLVDDLQIVENVLTDKFEVDLNEHVNLFMSLQGDQPSQLIV